MTKIYISTIILAICAVGKLNAQTVNAGELVMMPGTQFSTVGDFNNIPAGDVVNDGAFFVYANFNNDGMVTFTPSLNTGLVHFKGTTGAQHISGTLPSELNNVRFENKSAQPAFLLDGDISVGGTSNFYYGIVDNSNYNGKIVFEANATHDNASNESFVLGHAEQKGKNEFEFPVGDEGYYRSMAIGQSSQDGKNYVSEYFKKNSNDEYPHNKKQNKILLINNAEYWKFDTTDKAIDFALTLSWHEDTTPDEIIKNPENETSIGIVRWDETDKEWKFYDVATDSNNKTVTAKITKDGVFTLARINKALPPKEEDVVVYNGFSPNEDGINDFFFIEGLSIYPDNTLEIYNRWGVKVFETSGYGIDGNWFKGISEGRATISKGEKLSTGTYFYILRYKTSKDITREKVGYLYF
ncbi:gliding motility-associated C-terminal domain-containing protein [Flavobacterium sp. LS1R47]|uniref:Gliding motility-associated C-terminal domain-containing protein n=1 Tax=Flavobacterium frigoritolerans TaxID=2987686 RepID=A0A9X3CAM8_9FLAO|nr:gliding motility-associated C-terminal domain-containing protein [Flavobacterium frigoritolerans]MCV9934637.1 gliding motility-associated C-terminal domain-containing protein [Flavobacterium frigoritolerans]